MTTCPGSGAVTAPPRIALRTATAGDCETIWRWRNDPATRKASLAQGAIPLGVHRGWFNRAVTDPDRLFLIGLVGEEEIGFVRLDREGDAAMISIALDPTARGRGLAVPFLLESLAACHWPVARFTAVVRPENAASRASFERAGFTLTRGGNPLHYARPAPGPRLICVLANEIAADGTPNDQSAARLDLAARLMAEDREARLVTSGWAYARDPDTPIATLMAQAAEARGVPAERIVTSPRARDTVGDAAFLARDVIADGPIPIRVTVVTSAYHGARAREIFAFVLGPGVPLDIATTDEPVSAAQEASEEASRAAFRETFEAIAPGDLPAILDRLETAHPLYNGVIHGPDSPGVPR